MRRARHAQGQRGGAATERTLVEELSRQAQTTTEAGSTAAAGGDKKKTKPREQFGNTAQPELPHVERPSSSTLPTRFAGAAAASFAR